MSGHNYDWRCICVACEDRRRGLPPGTFSVGPRPRALKERVAVRRMKPAEPGKADLVVVIGRAWTLDDGTVRVQLDNVLLPWSGEFEIRDKEG